MAFVLVPGPQPVYLYRLGDTVPATGIEGGSIAINLDTGDTSDFDGSTWVKRATYLRDLDPATQTANAQTNVLILRELRLMRRGGIMASTFTEYDGPPEELDE